MPKLSLTKKQIEFIKKNRFSMSGTDMAKKLGVGKTVVNRYMRASGLQVPKELQVKFRAQAMIGRTTFTKAEDRKIRKWYLKKNIKALATEMGRSFTGVMGRLEAMGLEIPEDLRAQRKQIGMYRKGQVPANKGKKQTEFMSPEGIARTKATRFKRGHEPHNTNYDGHERISKDGYIEIRVRKGKYVLKHRLIWEQHHGKIPKGMIVVFKDRNPKNITIETLELISREENMKRNTIHRYPEELKIAIKRISKLNKKITNGTKQNS